MRVLLQCRELLKSTGQVLCQRTVLFVLLIGEMDCVFLFAPCLSDPAQGVAVRIVIFTICRNDVVVRRYSLEKIQSQVAIATVMGDFEYVDMKAVVVDELRVAQSRNNVISPGVSGE